MPLGGIKTAPVVYSSVLSPPAKRRRSDSTPSTDQSELLEINKHVDKVETCEQRKDISDKPPVAPRPHKARSGEHLPETKESNTRTRRTSKSPGNKRDSIELPEVHHGSGRSARSKTREKSKRRSSFVGGRISKIIPTSGAADLHKSISLDLPEDTRMELLTRAALDYSLASLKEEFPDLPEDFVNLANTTCMGTVDRLRAEGLFVQLVAPEEQQSNTERTNRDVERLDAMIAKAVEETEKLKLESEMWDKLVEQYEQDAKAAEQFAEEVKAGKHNMMSRPEGLTKKQQSLIDNAPSYTQYVDRLEYNNQTVLLSVNAISRITKKHEKCFEEGKDTVKRYAQVINDALFPSEMQDHLCAKPPTNS